MTALLDSLVRTVKVSSVLRDDVRAFGKQHLFDGRDDTCWNSDAGLPQSLQVSFTTDILLTRLEMMFQGGFVGIECQVGICSTDQTVVATIHPKDTNSLQSFSLATPLLVAVGQRLQLVFQQSSDLYGRVTVYTIHLHGHRAQQ